MPTHLSFAFATQFRTTSQSQGCVQIESPIFKISKPIFHLTQNKLPSMVHPYFDTIVTFVHPSPMTTEPTIRRFLYVLCPHSNFSNANLIPRNLENDVSHLTMILKLLQLNFRFNNLLKGIKCILYFNWWRLLISAMWTPPPPPLRKSLVKNYNQASYSIILSQNIKVLTQSLKYNFQNIY